jgi:hypothetical protein
MEIVLAEERLLGRSAEPLPGTRLEKQYGCDILVHRGDDAEPERVEVKGWGDPLVGRRGKLSWPLDVQVSQFEAARSGAPFRVEIVANLTRFLDGGDPYERLTVPGAFVADHALPSGYMVILEEIRGEATRSPNRPMTLTSQLRPEDIPPLGASRGQLEAFALTFPAWPGTMWDWEGLSAIGHKSRAEWESTGRLPSSLDTLRLYLLVEQRGLRHRDAPDEGELDVLRYMQALVDGIRTMLCAG